jgi:polysaccharide export outer membrane protein
LRALPASHVIGLLLVLGFAGLAGCASPPPPAPAEAGPWPLGPGDRLRIIVFEQNQLGGEFAVDDDGTVSLPLVGRLKLAGLAPADAEQLIAGRLAGRIVKNPQVNIDIIHYRPIYVYGEVTKPGGYDFAGTPTVIGAITLAGGYTYRAQTEGLTIVRYGDPEHRHYAVSEAAPVGPGDVIYVPERWF